MIIVEAKFNKKKKIFYFYGKELPIKRKLIWAFTDILGESKSESERKFISKIIQTLEGTSEEVNLTIYIEVPRKL